LEKSEKLFIIDNYIKLDENEKQISLSFMNNKSKFSAAKNNEISQTRNLDGNSKLTSQSMINTDLKNNSSKNDNLRKMSFIRDRDSLLNPIENISKNSDFGTPNEVFEINENLDNNINNNLRNFNKYLENLKDIITEEDSNFNNIFLTNLETNNLNDIKNFKTNLNFADLPEENENLNEEDYLNNDNEYDLKENNDNRISSIKDDFIKEAINQFMDKQKKKDFSFNTNSKLNQDYFKTYKIDFFKINKIFFENIENSEITYIQKESILNKNLCKNNIGEIFYNLLINCQDSDIDLFQNEIYGDLCFK